MGRPRQAVGRLLGPGGGSPEDAEDKGKGQGVTEAKAASWGYVDQVKSSRLDCPKRNRKFTGWL